MFDSPPFACFLYCFCLSWMAQGYCFFSFVTVRLSLKKKNWVSFFAEKETSLQDTFLSLWSPRDSFVFVSVTLVLILSCHVLHCLLVAVISLISILGHNFHLTSPFNPDWFLWFLLVEWFCRSCLFGLFISLGEDLLVILSSSLTVSFLLLFLSWFKSPETLLLYFLVSSPFGFDYFSVVCLRSCLVFLTLSSSKWRAILFALLFYLQFYCRSYLIFFISMDVLLLPCWHND